MPEPASTLTFVVDLDKHGTAGVQALSHLSKLLEVHREWDEAERVRAAAKAMRDEWNARKAAIADT